MPALEAGNGGVRDTSSLRQVPLAPTAFVTDCPDRRTKSAVIHGADCRRCHSPGSYLVCDQRLARPNRPNAPSPTCDVARSTPQDARGRSRTPNRLTPGRSVTQPSPHDDPATAEPMTRHNGPRVSILPPEVGQRAELAGSWSARDRDVGPAHAPRHARSPNRTSVPTHPVETPCITTPRNVDSHPTQRG